MDAAIDEVLDITADRFDFGWLARLAACGGLRFAFGCWPMAGEWLI